MSGSTGTAWPTEPLVGISWRAAATSGPRPRAATAFPASSADMVDWPSRAEATQTLCRPTALAIASKVRPFFFLAARICSVASVRVIPFLLRCKMNGKRSGQLVPAPALTMLATGRGRGLQAQGPRTASNLGDGIGKRENIDQGGPESGGARADFGGPKRRSVLCGGLRPR